MVSQKRIEANRRNAQKSTGPRTDAGKAVSSRNAVSHGLRAGAFSILPGEDAQAYARFQQAMVSELKPAGILQHDIVQDIVQTRWKIRRIPLIEAEFMRQAQQQVEIAHARAIRQATINRPGWKGSPSNALPPELESMPANTPIEILAAEFSVDQNAYTRLELYRVRLMRSMHTSLRELRKLREETSGNEESCGMGVSPVPGNDALEEHGPEARVTEMAKTPATEEMPARDVRPAQHGAATPQPIILPGTNEPNPPLKCRQEQGISAGPIKGIPFFEAIDVTTKEPRS